MNFEPTKAQIAACMAWSKMDYMQARNHLIAGALLARMGPVLPPPSSRAVKRP